MRLVAGLALLLLAACFATEATAHASLLSVEPADGSVLAQAPKRLELRFSESVTAGAVNLIDAAGKLRGDAAIDATADSVVITLPEGLPQGTSIVSYRVISQDGHPVTGAPDRDRGDGIKPPGIASPAHRDGPRPVGARNGRRWPVAGHNRARSHGSAASADPSRDVPAWRWRRVLARRTDASRRDAAAAAENVAADRAAVLGRSVPGGRACRARRDCARCRAAREPRWARQHQIRHHPFDQAGAGRGITRPCRAEPLSLDARAGAERAGREAAGTLDRG